MTPKPDPAAAYDSTSGSGHGAQGDPATRGPSVAPKELGETPAAAFAPDEMTPEEIELAEFFGPPDFLLAAEQFDAENGAGAAAELLRLAKENSRG